MTTLGTRGSRHAAAFVGKLGRAILHKQFLVTHGRVDLPFETICFKGSLEELARSANHAAITVIAHQSNGITEIVSSAQYVNGQKVTVELETKLRSLICGKGGRETS